MRRQAETGIDVVNDGEYGKAMRSSMDFGAWWSYVYPRLEGFELREEQAKQGRAAWTHGSKERKEQVKLFVQVFLGMVLGGLVLAWLMYPFPSGPPAQFP